MKIKTSTVLSLVSLVSIATTSAPVFASEFDTILNGYLGRGKVDDRTQAIAQTNISTRQAQIEQQIAAGVQSGQLTSSEEADVRQDLESVATLQGQYLSVNGKLNNIQIQNLLNQLTAVTNKLNAYLTNSETVANSTPHHNNWMHQYGHREGWGNERMAEGHVDSYQAELDAKIQQALLGGKISVDMAHSLRADLNATEQDQARMTADGRFTPDERQQVMTSLNNLNAKIDQDIAMYRSGRHHGDWHGDWHGDRRQSMLKQRIYDGLNSGRLSRSEANRLLASAQRIDDMEAQMRVSNNRLTSMEQRVLLNRMNELNSDINNELTDHNVW